jgi:hypothetical protein
MKIIIKRKLVSALRDFGFCCLILLAFFLTAILHAHISNKGQSIAKSFSPEKTAEGAIIAIKSFLFILASIITFVFAIVRIIFLQNLENIERVLFADIFILFFLTHQIVLIFIIADLTFFFLVHSGNRLILTLFRFGFHVNQKRIVKKTVRGVYVTTDGQENMVREFRRFLEEQDAGKEETINRVIEQLNHINTLNNSRQYPIQSEQGVVEFNNYNDVIEAGNEITEIERALMSDIQAQAQNRQQQQQPPQQQPQRSEYKSHASYTAFPANKGYGKPSGPLRNLTEPDTKKKGNEKRWN